MVVPSDIFAEFSLESVLSCKYAKKLVTKKFKSYDEAAEWITQFKDKKY